VLPLEKDFEKITADDIKTVFSEICVSNEKLNEILKNI
jgi:NACalpha-BTF3-like transcription factor